MAGDPAQEPTNGRARRTGDESRLHHLLQSVVTATTDAVLITEATPIDEEEGGPRIVYANDAFERMTGYPSAEVVGRTPRMLQCEGTDGGELRRIRQALSSWQTVEAELLNRRRDGGEFWVQVSIAPAQDADGTITHWISIQRDITERRRRERLHDERLHTAREQLHSAFHHAPIGMAVATPVGVLTRVNAALSSLLGRPSDDLVGTTLFELTHADDRSLAERACRDLGTLRSTSQVTCRFEHAGGHVMDVVVHSSLVRDARGEPDHVVMHVADVSERNALERRLLHQALSDQLTGLPNRAMFFDRLTQALARRNRDGSGLAVLFIDVDGFKDINDRLGHVVGDEVLRSVAKRLETLVRPGDTVARFGGDEFVVLCEHTAEAEAATVAGRLVAGLDPPHADDPAAVSASIGVMVATGPSPAFVHDLIRDADAAMYEAKRGGRGRVVSFDDSMRARSDDRRETELGLRVALAEEELRLHYQPQIDLRDGRVVGLEALMRWQHPQRGLLLPEHFIELAETRGLIGELGLWAAERACLDAVARGLGVVTWINVSVHQFGEELVRRLGEVLRRTGLPAHLLGLEVTESVLMQDLSVARGQLAALRDLGVRLAIDDFGTGYSSLAYLAELPVDIVKVDRSFTARLEPPGSGRSVITAVLGMARALGIDVVVEGVETASQLALLGDLGVERAQGFLLGRPEPAGPAAGSRTLRPADPAAG